MGLQRWLLAVGFYLASVLGTGNSVMTAETQRYTCRTFGSGVVQPFIGQSFYVRSDCPFTLIHFTHNRVECEITIRRDDSGLLVFVEISINKIRTVLQNGSILVEEKSVSLPYDHTYQHIFQYGIYTKLRSSLLPLSVTWNDVPGGKDSLWVELNQELSSDMTGLCGSSKAAGSRQQIISESVLAEDTCQTRDPVSSVSPVCRQFFSFTLDCFQASTLQYIQLCEENIYGFEKSKSISCAFFREMIQQCGNGSFAWNIWRAATECDKPSCPGDLEYVEQGLAFVPSCSNHNLRFSNQDLTSSCVCPEGKVLNDGAAGFRCVSVSSCPCEFAGMSYQPGESRSTKCQSCVCARGEWQCSENVCPTPCLIEGPFVRTFDGKQYAVPGKCTYVASQGQNWKIIVEFSAKAPAVKSVILQIFQETYTFSEYRVTVGEEEITELHQSDNALVFWQSSMYSQVYTSLGVNIQVQMSPEIQLYITPPGNQKDMISGLCGNNNNDTTDDFSTSGGIVENSAQPFALSWSVGGCAVNIPPFCTITDNEIFAEEKCSVLNDPRGVFAECHAHIPTDHYYTACIQRTCKCGSSLQQCLCVALGSYAKACASLGVVVGDWREATDCTVKCQKNQEFFYDILACNRTCCSLSGPDPRCGLDEGPVEGCGCPEGTHLSRGHICTPKAECDCHYYGGTTPPGPADIDGQKCSCENGELHCSKDCGCRNGKVCVHCSEDPVNTAQKSCDSLSKPTGISVTCESGCYCPSDQYEDHHGSCVSLDDCTCVYSGQVFSAGQSVRTNCKTCVCGQGQWHCKDKPCPGRCQVYGNGHFQTFDSKWFRFDGNCMYTLVEDECGNKNSTFSIRVESVPCCDEALTCSRSIILDLQDKVTLVLSDMRVSQSYHVGGIQEDLQYTIYTVGLYIVISVPNKGITLIWDKHTRVTVELSAMWRNKVCGLCGNFDSNEMNDLQKSNSTVMSSPLTFGNSWKVPPCSDVLTEIFPCERHSYCSTWADRRCMIITGDTFKDCHLKVDPEPYFHACVQESCSCEFEGKFLGFCTAVAAYAEACSDVGVCINWRTPDLCPVYCDYYNEQGQCSWHYEACGQMLICGRSSLTHKLEGCYPRCSKAAPYYDENIGKCTELRNCSCYFNDTIIQPGAVVLIQSTACRCQNGTVHCLALPTTTTPPPTTAGPTELPTITPPPTTAGPTELPTTTTLPPTTAGLTELPTITPPPTTAGLTELPTITPPPTTAGPTELPTTTLPPTTAGPTELPTTTLPLTTAGPTELPTTTTLPPTTAGPTELPTITPPSTTAGPTELPTITPPPTTAGPTELPTTTTLPPTTAGPTELPTTTPPPTTAGPTELPTTTPPPTTAGPTELPTTTTLPPTTAGPTELPTTTLPPTTAGPTELPTTTLPPPTTAGPTELPTTTPPPTTAGPTELPTTTPPPTTAGPTELPTTTPPSTTAGPTELPTITPPPTTAGPTELPTITPPPTTAGPTELPTTTTLPPTTAGPTELPTITPPPTTAGLTELPTTTLPPTTAGPTELPTITPPPTTAEPTELPTTTTLPPTTAGPTELPTITPPPTTAGLTELPTTTLPPTTAGPTELPTITPPPTTAEPTELPTTTTLPPTTAGLTELPTITPPSTTAGPTELPTTTTLPPTTTGPTELPTTTTLPPTTAGPTELPTTTLPPPTTAGPTELPTTTPPPTTAGPTELPTTIPPSPSTTSATTTSPTTITPCECKDLKRKKSWSCNETWVEDCFSKSCVNRKIELTPVVCPEPVIPSCPRQQVRKVSDGCCETWKCDCRCDLYGDPHYITFQGVTFDFLDDCTYILVEERSPRHHLMIAVDNFYCVPGLEGSCVKGIILKYQTSVATLKIIPPLFSVKATLNNMTIEPPYEEQGWRFEVTGYIVSIYLPEIRSYVSLSPSYNLVINLAMEHFFNNTQGQCGVCGGGSCIRKGGQIEDDSCCGKTAYDWVYDDPQKPACLSAPKDVPCHWGTSRPPPTPCPASSLCELLHHPVFSNCSRFVDLAVKKKSCDFDSCRTGACSSLEQAAEECKKAGFCVDWRRLTHGGCDWKCPAGLVYRECRNKLDDFCYGGVKYPGGSFEPSSAGCFCPSGLKRAGAHSNICVSECRHCKGPLGEPRLPGEVWQSGCHLCTCNNQTRTEECFLKPLEPPPTCGPDAELVNTSCCGDLACLEKTCIYNGKTYKMGDRWKDAAHPCMSFLCNKDGVQTETKVCPTENCQEQDRIWDDQHCCFTCDQSCAPKVTSINITIDNCTTIMQMPVCQGQCVSQPSRVVLHGDVQMEHKWRCCQEQSSERRSVTLQCSDLSERRYAYKHITSCECGACGILR